MSAATLDFWFDFASTYSYPAAMTVEQRAGGVAVRWRPFLLGPIFAGLGWRDSPFNLQPAKGRYMWRDLERLCAAEGLVFRRPAVFPQHSVLAARTALVCLDSAHGPAFCRAVFDAQFAAGADIADPDVLAAILGRLDLDAASVLGAATAPANKQRLRDEVSAAAAAGIFGAPTFLAGEEMFWGFDRLEAAVGWAAGR